jgi:GT2 family glycosyltransferase
MPLSVSSDRTTAPGSGRSRVRLSVVTVNWNSRDDLAACLRSLCEQTRADLEVLIVDNASEDGSLEMVRERYPQFKLLEQDRNLGFAEGCNVGIAHATGSWIALLNNDAIADPHWAETLIDAAERAPESCGMLQSLMLFQRTPATVNSTGIGLSRQGTGYDRGGGDEPPEPSAPWEPVFCPTGGAAAYRRSTLEAIKLSTGYFDPAHFCYYEDMDLGWRARLAGFEALYIPSSVVHHKYHGSTVRRGRAWLVRLATINRARTLIKNASSGFIARTLPMSLWQLIRLASVCGPSALRDYYSAVRESLKLRVEVEGKRRLKRNVIEEQWAK